MQIIAFLVLLPFSKDTWERAERLLAGDLATYWQRANVNPYEANKDHLIEGAEKLLIHGRPRSALACLRVMMYDEIFFLPDLAVRILIGILTVEEKNIKADPNDITDAIQWLQEHPPEPIDQLLQIEWGFQGLLDHNHGTGPRYLELHMANNPDFFCDLIKMVFKSEKEESAKRDVSDAEQNKIQTAYRLINDWQTPPGTLQDGSFDATLFNKWLGEVKRILSESGHLRVGIGRVGEVLAHAPGDPDGLCLHRTIANALNDRDHEEMRNGYTRGLYNGRGVFMYTGGKQELELAKKYHANADALEHNGYVRIGAALREFAKSYERDAAAEAARKEEED